MVRAALTWARSSSERMSLRERTTSLTSGPVPAGRMRLRASSSTSPASGRPSRIAGRDLVDVLLEDLDEGRERELN